MYPKQEVVAMLLAGGQGSRLGALTRDLAKPAVPYGGKYRIIDFPLSNCVNSGIETVGVLTQYSPLVLHEYIGSGQPWDLDSIDSGVHVLSPFQKYKGSGWYTGTSNAIYQNINFIDRYDPEYVVILSGDHIYKMDYSTMIQYHKDKNADCTIAVIDVSLEEASRFGILNTNEDGSIYEFEEKPKQPKSTNASMGIYVFTWEKLRKYLIEDQLDLSSSNDFGKNVLPTMLENGEKMYAYSFSGYWKDVGTIESLWEANMDLLNPNVELDLSAENWKIYARTRVMPPHYVGKNAMVQNSIVTEGSNVYGELEFSVLFTGVTVEEGAKVNASIVMPGAVIKKGANVQYAIIGEDAVIGENAVIGGKPEDAEDATAWGIAVVGPNCVVEDNQVVNPKEMIATEEV